MTIRYVAADGIRAFDFGDECIVFNPLSWDAHLLNPAAAAVLELLGDGSQSLAEIEQYLREMLLDAEQAEAAEHSHALLGELAQLGLVHPLADATTDR